MGTGHQRIRGTACCVALFAAFLGGCALATQPPPGNPPPKTTTATATISGSSVTFSLDHVDARVANVVVNEGTKKLF